MNPNFNHSPGASYMDHIHAGKFGGEGAVQGTFLRF
jgi:hypothetical protein